jgi:AraC-like DNA-binding protein
MPKAVSRQVGSHPSCSGLLTRFAFAHAQHQGLDCAALLKQAGLTLTDIEDRTKPLSATAQIRFVQLVADSLGDKNLGVHIAQDFDLRQVGLLFYVAASAATLGDALQRVARYSAILNEGIVLKVQKGKFLRVAIQYSGVARHSDIHQIEGWIVAILRLCRQLTDREIAPIHVRIMHRGDENHELSRFLNRDIEMSARADEIDLPLASADLLVVSADPYLNELTERYCDEALAHRDTKSSPLRFKVENTIAALLPHGQARIETVAAKLGMSPRTLARKLAVESHSFAGILRDMRSDLAERYLADREIQISQIAWLLGYGEVGAFTRAYQRWTGRTPSAARASNS